MHVLHKGCYLCKSKKCQEDDDLQDDDESNLNRIKPEKERIFVTELRRGNVMSYECMKVNL